MDICLLAIRPWRSLPKDKIKKRTRSFFISHSASLSCHVEQRRVLHTERGNPSFKLFSRQTNGIEKRITYRLMEESKIRLHPEEVCAEKDWKRWGVNWAFHQTPFVSRLGFFWQADHMRRNKNGAASVTRSPFCGQRVRDVFFWWAQKIIAHRHDHYQLQIWGMVTSVTTWQNCQHSLGNGEEKKNEKYLWNQKEKRCQLSPLAIPFNR